MIDLGPCGCRRCTLCKCAAVAEAHGFPVCNYHGAHGEDDPACPHCEQPELTDREALALDLAKVARDLRRLGSSPATRDRDVDVALYDIHASVDRLARQLAPEMFTDGEVADHG